MSLAIDDPASDAPAPPGYRLLEEVERRPELGTTFRAHDIRRDTPVEVTFIATDLSHDVRYRDRFERRRRLLASMRHPALVPQVDAGELGERLFVVAEPMPGRPLRGVLEAGPLSPARALAILAPVADLLDRLHGARLPAGDVTPWSIAVDDADRASLTRPGLAGVSLRATTPAEISTDALAYSAPEQLRGLAAGSRTDVYGLAVVLFEAISGGLPFVMGPSGTQLPVRAALARRSLPAPSVSARHRELGRQFDAVLKAALSESPAARPVSPRELVERLAEALEQDGVSLPATRPRQRPAAIGRTAERPAAGRPRAGDRPSPQRRTTVNEAARAGGAPGESAERSREPEVAAAVPLRTGGRRSRSRSRLHGVRATAPVAAAAMLAGAVLAVSDEPAEPAAPAPQALRTSAGVLGIAYPSTWQRQEDASGAVALSLEAPLVLTPRPGIEAQPESRLLAGLVTETGPSLLAAGLERRLGGEVKPDAVRLGANEAYRYRDLAVGRDEVRSTIYAVPTSAGVATVACLSPRFIDTLEGQCEAMATTLTLSGAQALPLGPNAEYGGLVSRIVAQADAARRQNRIQLRRARRAGGQAAQAADLAAVFRRSAARLASSGSRAGTAEIHRQLVDALRGVRNGYDGLAAAAASRDRRAYDVARRVVSAREAGLTRALERMRRLGYRLR